MPINLQLLRTSTFRFAAAYLVIFALSVAAILGYVYWNTAVLLERQTEETITAEVQGLADQYRIRGLPGILDTVKRRSSQDTGSLYYFSNFVGRKLAGNLPGLPVSAKPGKNWPMRSSKASCRSMSRLRASAISIASGSERRTVVVDARPDFARGELAGEDRASTFSIPRRVDRVVELQVRLAMLRVRSVTT